MQRQFMHNLGMVGVLLVLSGVALGILASYVWRH
jgi:hypothetical protein